MDTYTRPDWARSALLTIDVQRDFTLPGAVCCIAGTMEVIPAMQRLTQAYRASSMPIVHVVRLYLPDGSNVDLCRREQIENGMKMGAPGSEGAEIMQELLPAPSIRLDATALLQGKLQRIGAHEWIVFKPRWGAFYRTDLEEHLHQLGVNTLVFSGCNFPNCPRTSMYEASERDFRVVLVKDAVSGLYDRGLDELTRIGVHVVTTEECISIVTSSTAAT